MKSEEILAKSLDEILLMGRTGRGKDNERWE